MKILPVLSSLIGKQRMTDKEFFRKVANGKEDFLQDFIKRAKVKNVWGYKLPVAAIGDIFQGKIWAATDETRRASKRQKDLADILRLIEVKAELKNALPQELREQLKLN